jgi:hypothetical protein
MLDKAVRLDSIRFDALRQDAAVRPHQIFFDSAVEQFMTNFYTIKCSGRALYDPI